MNRRYSKNHPAVMYARQQLRRERVARFEEMCGLAVLVSMIANTAWLGGVNAPAAVSVSVFVTHAIAALALLMGRAE